jgi:SnoaL-like polyketide cyclase
MAKESSTNSFARGNSVAVEVTWTGTQTGPLVGPSGKIPPSGRSWSVLGAQLITIQGDKPKERRQYFDWLTLLPRIEAVAQKRSETRQRG